MRQDRERLKTARNFFLAAAFPGLLLPLLSGCTTGGATGSSPATVSSAARGALKAPNQLKTLSVDRRALLRVNSVLIAPVQFRGNARLDGGDQERLDHELETAAGRELDVDVTPPSKAGNLILKGTSGNDLAAAAVASAKKFKSDGVILTTISTLEEREGSRVGTDSPAALGFTMTLLRTEDGTQVWSSSYFVQDHAVTDNLLTARDAGWGSLQEHLSEGFSAALRELRVQRETAFGNGGR